MTNSNDYDRLRAIASDKITIAGIQGGHVRHDVHEAMLGLLALIDDLHARLSPEPRREDCGQNMAGFDEAAWDQRIRTMISRWENPEVAYTPIVRGRLMTDQERHSLFHQIKRLVKQTYTSPRAAAERRVVEAAKAYVKLSIDQSGRSPMSCQFEELRASVAALEAK